MRLTGVRMNEHIHNLFSKDIDLVINALQHYIITEENRLIKENAGDREWTELEQYRRTLTNFKFLETIYGT